MAGIWRGGKVGAVQSRRADSFGLARPAVLHSRDGAGWDTGVIMIELSPETETLARRLADARQVTVDAAVREALEASAQATGVIPRFGPSRGRSGVSVATRRERMDKTVREIASMPILDARSPEEIMDDLNAV